MASIFISGGAAGIGLATAERFDREGWTVGVYDGDTDALAAAQAAHPTWITGELDVRDAEQWARALSAFTAHTGGTLDVPDNDAAVKAEVDIVVLGVTLGAQAAFPSLKATPGSHLVNIASASAIYGQPGIATYSASKFYVAGLTEALELEWAPHGVRVVGIWPLWAK